MMWTFVPVTTLSLFSILYCFYTEKDFVVSVGLFAALIYISSLFKSLFGRAKISADEVRVTEVLYRFTPRYPDESNFSRVQCWHMSMDMLAFAGLWVTVFFESWVLPWIVEMIHATYS
jgi:hypothetical protein